MKYPPVRYFVRGHEVTTFPEPILSEWERIKPAGNIKSANYVPAGREMGIDLPPSFFVSRFGLCSVLVEVRS